VPELGDTRIDGGDVITETRLTIDAPGYDAVAARLYAGFPYDADTVLPTPCCISAWRVYTYRGASLDRRALPTLPAGMVASDLPGTGTHEAWQSSVYAIDGIDSSRPSPWSAAETAEAVDVMASRGDYAP
jgi:hypothetical protein